MRMLKELLKRNIKLFFKDKGLFITSLITPLILLVLYITFLGNMYKQTFVSNLPASLPDDLINGLVGSQLISSILAVSCITVAFCTNFMIVQDKVTGTINDIRITPVKTSIISFSYFLASLISTLIICYTLTFVCLVYIAIIGWYFTFLDVLLILFDVFLLVLFGTSISSIINMFLISQGQMSAVGTIISSGYGFICGAYMPVSSYGESLQKIISFLPSTYGTSLIRNHSMNPIVEKLKEYGISDESIIAMKDAFDCNIYINDTKISIIMMVLIVAVSTIILLILYILLNKFYKQKNI